MKKIIRLTESDLKNIIKETLETMLKKPGGDLEYLINICEEYDLNNIKLFFESVDTVLLERLLGTKIPKIDEDTKYVAEFILPNYGWGDKYACVLSALEFGGYGVSKNYICDIPYDMFHCLLNNFQFKGGKWVRNDNFNYVNESSSVSSLKKKIFCYQNNKIYLSATDAAEELGITVRAVCRCAKKDGDLISTHGYNFCYLEDWYEGWTPRKSIQGKHKFSEEQKSLMRKNNKNSKKVKCIDTGKVYRSLNEASRETGISSELISKVAAHKKNHNRAGGFRWEYIEE